MSTSRNNTERQQLKSLFRYSDLKQLTTSPTRTSKDSKSLIDLIADSCPQDNRDSGVITSHLSDHELIYCVRKLNWQSAPSQIKTFRNYANYNPVHFARICKVSGLMPLFPLRLCPVWISCGTISGLSLIWLLIVTLLSYKDV